MKGKIKGALSIILRIFQGYLHIVFHVFLRDLLNEFFFLVDLEGKDIYGKNLREIYLNHNEAIEMS